MAIAACRAARTSLTIAVLAAGLAGCASGPEVSRYPSLEPERGLVYFYRGRGSDDGPARLLIEQNGSRLGTLRPGTFFYHHVEPGRHYFSARAIGPDSDGREAGTSLTVSAGARHYIQARAPGRQARIAVKFAAQARPTLEQLRPVAAPEPGAAGGNQPLRKR